MVRLRNMLWQSPSAMKSTSRAKDKNLRRLASDPNDAVGTISSRRLNSIAQIIRATRYLEIGLSKGETLEAIRISDRTGVDPKPRFCVSALPKGISVYATRSDDFFASLGPAATFDLIFVDGLHEYRQCYRDVLHSIAHLSPQGVVVVDDVVPTSAAAAHPILSHAEFAAKASGRQLDDWMGDVFRAAIGLATLHAELEVRTIVDNQGRGQMAVWRSNFHQLGAKKVADPVLLDDLATHTYETTFGGGVPPIFRPVTMTELLEELSYRVGDSNWRPK